MPSSSDYTLAKKIINIQQNLELINDLNAQPEYNNTFSTVIGNDLYPCEGQCIGDQGPPGEPGDRYLTTFTDILYKYVMDTGNIGVQVEAGLAYINGHTIRCVYDTPNPPFDSFTATVVSYNKTSGIMILSGITNISSGFVYSTRRTYKVNIDYYYYNPQPIQKLPILNDNNSNTPCYVNFTTKPIGETTNFTVSNNIYLNPLNGELFANCIFDMNSNHRTNTTSLDEYYAIDFIQNLQPKKYYTTNKPTLERYGFLAEDIALVYDDLGFIDNSGGVCYSDILVPTVSSLKNVLNRVESLEYRQSNSVLKNIVNDALNGDVHVKNLFESNTDSPIDVSLVDDYHAIDFIQNLRPKKYYTSNKPTMERYGFFPEDIALAYDNLGLLDNSGVCHSDILAVVVSTLKNVLNRLDSIEFHLSEL